MISTSTCTPRVWYLRRNVPLPYPYKVVVHGWNGITTNIDTVRSICLWRYDSIQTIECKKMSSIIVLPFSCCISRCQFSFQVIKYLSPFRHCLWRCLPRCTSEIVSPKFSHWFSWRSRSRQSIAKMPESPNHQQPSTMVVFCNLKSMGISRAVPSPWSYMR